MIDTSDPFDFDIRVQTLVLLIARFLTLNEDGKGFTLLANPQAMRLKNAGLIKDKRSVRQPTQEELDAALESEPNIIQRFFGE